MTYNVFGGTLNPTLLLLHNVKAAICLQKWVVPSSSSLVPPGPTLNPIRVWGTLRALAGSAEPNRQTLYCAFWAENHAFDDTTSTINHLFVSQLEF